MDIYKDDDNPIERKEQEDPSSMKVEKEEMDYSADFLCNNFLIEFRDGQIETAIVYLDALGTVIEKDYDFDMNILNENNIIRIISSFLCVKNMSNEVMENLCKAALHVLEVVLERENIESIRTIIEIELPSRLCFLLKYKLKMSANILKVLINLLPYQRDLLVAIINEDIPLSFFYDALCLSNCPLPEFSFEYSIKFLKEGIDWYSNYLSTRDFINQEITATTIDKVFSIIFDMINVFQPIEYPSFGLILLGSFIKTPVCFWSEFVEKIYHVVSACMTSSFFLIRERALFIVKKLIEMQIYPPEISYESLIESITWPSRNKREKDIEYRDFNTIASLASSIVEKIIIEDPSQIKIFFSIGIIDAIREGLSEGVFSVTLSIQSLLCNFVILSDHKTFTLFLEDNGIEDIFKAMESEESIIPALHAIHRVLSAAPHYLPTVLESINEEVYELIENILNSDDEEAREIAERILQLKEDEK